MLTREFAEDFCQKWVGARNSHDIDQILNQYTDDCSLDSPMAVKFVPLSNGKLQGKEAIREYWINGLQFLPDLHFAVIDILVGLDTITIYYLNTLMDKKAVEVMWLDGSGKVYKSILQYSEETFDSFY